MRALRVAIVGSGPSGFYAAQELLKQPDIQAIDMFERLPVPFGLVRYGVAPDHPKIKNVTKVFEKTAEHPKFSFFGNVHVGKDISIQELKRYYDAVILAIGAESDRKLGIPGENLAGSHTATAFVAWYNGHPDFQDRNFDFSGERAVIIGQGNVAMDVARILSKTPDELKNTDISRGALECLAQSKIKEIHMFGRRGPAQAAFTSPEIKEMGELIDCDVILDPKDLQLNEASLKELEDPANAGAKKNYEILQHLASKPLGDRKRKFFLHFFRGPVEIAGQNKVQKVKFEVNALSGEPGRQKVAPTGQFEEFGCDIFFRSVGYKGVPLAGIPFSEKEGVIPNQDGRVFENGKVMTGWYVTGWIKRGPSGIIGTNKPDSEKTVQSLLSDADILPPCEMPSTQEVAKFLQNKQIKIVTFMDWRKIDAAEIDLGVQCGKTREKFVRVQDMLAHLK